MKTFKLFSVIFISVLLLSSCSKENADPRDAFIGDYKEDFFSHINIQETISSTDYGTVQNVYSAVYHRVDNYYIGKSSTKDKIYRSIGPAKFEGTVYGTRVVFEETNEVLEKSDFIYTFKKELSGQLIDGKLHLKAKLSGTAARISDGIIFPFTGSYESIDYKK